LNRYATAIKWLSVALILLSAVFILRRLPVGPLVERLGTWIDGLGGWGPAVFGAVYVVAVVLLFPASALTLLAGAIFGLAVGMVTVSLASTTGAALAFLVSRYLARGAISRRLQRYPKFAAIDRAISESGWKIVALLRLSPAVPFNLQNYLYGLTGIRFGVYVLTSWLAMLPGTFLYVYLGYAGRAGLEAAAGGERSRTPAEWAMLGVGLLATVAVTVYVTRLARQALRQHADLAAEPAPAGDPAERPGTAGWPWGATVAALLALAAVALAVYVQLNPDFIAGLFRGAD
jgi:uncharacterized membrane protein YdjX (TVP38/TMEM64 family)